MSFKERIKKDAPVFLNPDEFAEEVAYTAGGAAKSINAVVVHYQLVPSQENVYRSLKKQAEVFIANDSEKGVTAINKKDDRITLKDTAGQEQEARINEIVNSDRGIWHLLVGW